MQKILLNKKSNFEIEDGGSITNIEKLFDSLNETISFMESLLNSSPYCVEFATDSDSITATYENMVLTEPNFKITKCNNQFKVSFGFRELTESEENFETVQTAIAYLSDDQALTVKNLYIDWEDDPNGYEYSTKKAGDLRRIYKNKLWKLQKDHNKQEDWYPGADPTLWVEIVEGHDGTIEDPIPVPDSVTTSGFEYEYGKYYLDDEDIYLAKREGKSDGEVEKLYFKPSALIGQYFEKVEQ